MGAEGVWDWNLRTDIRGHNFYMGNLYESERKDELLFSFGDLADFSL